MEISIRPARPEDAGGIARVHVDTWRSNYAGIIPAAHLASMSYERSQAKWHEHLVHPQDEETFVAFDPSGQIVGFSSGGAAREDSHGIDGELYTLYILKAFQGMGIGRLLVYRVTEYLLEAGFHTMLIWVLKDNPARGFYERLGGQLMFEKVVEIGGMPLVDVGYIWLDLAGIARTNPCR